LHSIVLLKGERRPGKTAFKKGNKSMVSMTKKLFWLVICAEIWGCASAGVDEKQYACFDDKECGSGWICVLQNADDLAGACQPTTGTLGTETDEDVAIVLESVDSETTNGISDVEETGPEDANQADSGSESSAARVQYSVCLEQFCPTSLAECNENPLCVEEINCALDCPVQDEVSCVELCFSQNGPKTNEAKALDDCYLLYCLAN
jgi:hypothetical protein